MSRGTDANKAGESGWRETIKIIVHALILAMIVRIFFYPALQHSLGLDEADPAGRRLSVRLEAGLRLQPLLLPVGHRPLQGRIFAAEPKRGDVAVFKLPRDNSTDFIKRVIGLPGDEIRCAAACSTSTARPCRKVRKGDFISPEEDRRSRASRKRCRTA